VRPHHGRANRASIDRSDPVVIVGEPADEIAEAWNDFYSLALVWLGLDALVLITLYIVLGRVLDPLKSLSRGMQSLEDGHYGTRIAEPKVKELAHITNRFNTLSGALDTARDENSRLYQQLISVQEQERRDIASELHDEAGRVSSVSLPTRRRFRISPVNSLTSLRRKFHGVSARFSPSPSG
jgi:two-component system sensor histidine kinase UhpB